MTTAVWVCQLLVTTVFLFSGVSKSTRSVAALVAAGQTGVEGLPRRLVRFIGVMELVGVCGLWLPLALGTFPLLTPLAAAGLALVMALAAPVHVRRREYLTAAGNLAILGLCVAVAIGHARGR